MHVTAADTAVGDGDLHIVLSPCLGLILDDLELVLIIDDEGQTLEISVRTSNKTVLTETRSLTHSLGSVTA